MAAPIADMADVVFAIPPIARRYRRELANSGASAREIDDIFRGNQMAVLAALSVRFTPEFRERAQTTLRDGSMPVMDPIIREVHDAMADSADRAEDVAVRERRPEVPQAAINYRTNAWRERVPSNQRRQPGYTVWNLRNNEYHHSYYYQ